MLRAPSRGSRAGNGALIGAPRRDSLRFFTFASGMSGCVGGCAHTCARRTHERPRAGSLLSVCLSACERVRPRERPPAVGRARATRKHGDENNTLNKYMLTRIIAVSFCHLVVESVLLNEPLLTLTFHMLPGSSR